MHPNRLCGAALLLLAGAAQAQQDQPPASCTGLAPDSFEAAMLGCGGSVESSEPGVPPRVVDMLAEVPLDGPSLRPPVLRLGEMGGPIATAEGHISAVEQLSAPSENQPAASEAAVMAGAAGEIAAGVPVPDGQRPPEGLCRVWFPGRHEGLQRPPTSCDVEVPEGAMLIRG
jgi:hypothetical protein